MWKLYGHCSDLNFSQGFWLSGAPAVWQAAPDWSKSIWFSRTKLSKHMLCTWTAIEVINFFINRGSVLYGCLLYYRKAFDLVIHVIMFRNLLDRKISPIFIRTMIFMYLHQSFYIRWQKTRSYSFTVTNGTKQGGVFSPKGGFVKYLEPLLGLYNCWPLVWWTCNGRWSDSTEPISSRT